MTTLHTIGKAVVTEAFDYSVPQEYAGAVRTVRVPAGEYPIEIRRTQYGTTYAGIAFEGVCTYSGWFGSNTLVEKPNTPESAFAQKYLYEIVSFLRGERSYRPGVRFELAPGYDISDDRLTQGGAVIWVTGV